MAILHHLKAATRIFVLLALFTGNARASLSFTNLANWSSTINGDPYDVAVEDGRAYVAMDEGGLVIVDVVDPTHPTVLGRVAIPGHSRSVKFVNPFAFVGCGTNGLAIVSAINPSNPILMSQYPVQGELLDFSVDYLAPPRVHLATGTNGLVILDISNQYAPTKIGGTNLPAYDVETFRYVTYSNITPILTNRYAYVASGTNGLYVLNVDNPATPVRVAQEHLATYTNLVSGPQYIYSIEGRAFFPYGRRPDMRSFTEGSLAGEGIGKLTIYSSIAAGIISTNARYFQSLNGSQGSWTLFSPIASTNHSAPRAVAGDAAFHYFVEPKRGLQIFDAVDNFVGEAVLNGDSVQRVLPAGDRIYIGDSQNGLKILQLNAATNAVSLTGFRNIGSVLDFDVLGSNIFLVGGATFTVLNATAAAQPLPLYSTNLSGLVQEVGVYQNRAYLSTRETNNSKIYTFDLSNMTKIKLLTNSAFGPFSGFNFAGPNIFGASDGISSFSTNANGTLTQLQRIKNNATLPNLGLKVVGAKAYVCERNVGLKIYNVSNPASMQLLSTFTTTDPQAVDISGNLAFVADGNNGVIVVDVTDPLKPAMAGHLAADLPVYDIAVRNDLLYLACGQKGFSLWKIKSQGAQQIQFSAPATATTRSAPFRVSATSSSGLPVQLTISGPGQLSNGLVTTTGSGTIKLTATQAGNGDYSPVSAEFNITVSFVPRDSQTITFDPIPDRMVLDDPFYINPSVSSGLPLVVTISGPAGLSANLVTLQGIGFVQITASQEGTRDIAPASVTRSFYIDSLETAVASDLLTRVPALQPELTLPDADADHDGIPNVVEFILGSDPTSATSAEGRSTASIFKSEDGVYLLVTYKRPRTLRYPTAIEVADWKAPGPLTWQSFPPSFNDDGTGSFLWPMTPGSFPLIRFVIAYP